MIHRRSVYRGVFLFVLGLVLKFMSLPLPNALPERGFSKMKLLKYRSRSRMSNKTLEALMGITINGTEYRTPECDTLINVCVQIWLAKKKLCKLPVPKSSEVLHSSQVNNNESDTVSSWDVCTQTETVSVQKKSKNLWLRWAFKLQMIILCQSRSQSRRFYVDLNNERCRWRKQKNGLSQGSVHSPIISNIYTNDQPLLNGTHSFIYANDLCVTAQQPSFVEVETTIEESLSDLTH